MEEHSSRPPFRWLPYVCLALIVLGIGVATYLTITHYTTTVTLACPENSVINCAKVTSSSYSVIFGIPLAVLGLAYFIGIFALYLPKVWHAKNPLLPWVRLAAVLSGMVMVFWLLYVELFLVNAFCLYCTALHIIIFLLFVLTVFGTALTPKTA